MPADETLIKPAQTKKSQFGNNRTESLPPNGHRQGHLENKASCCYYDVIRVDRFHCFNLLRDEGQRAKVIAQIDRIAAMEFTQGSVNHKNHLWS